MRFLHQLSSKVHIKYVQLISIYTVHALTSNTKKRSIYNTNNNKSSQLAPQIAKEMCI